MSFYKPLLSPTPSSLPPPKQIVEVGKQFRIVSGTPGYPNIEFYAGRDAKGEEVWMDYNWDENRNLIRALSEEVLKLSK